MRQRRNFDALAHAFALDIRPKAKNLKTSTASGHKHITPVSYRLHSNQLNASYY
jgi:hypothetical protein